MVYRILSLFKERILLEDFLKIIFLHGEIYLSFHHSSFAFLLRYFFSNVNGKTTMWQHTPKVVNWKHTTIYLINGDKLAAIFGTNVLRHSPYSRRAIPLVGKYSISDNIYWLMSLGHIHSFIHSIHDLVVKNPVLFSQSYLSCLHPHCNNNTNQLCRGSTSSYYY
jgi:hypothetical protein